MLNIKMENGHLGGGIGTPDGSQSGMHVMYGGGHPGGGGGPGDYNPAHSHSYLGPSPPSFMNGLSGHHSGGFCSQMSLNQNPPPPNNRPLQCGGCRGPILERFYLDALDNYWHNSCLKCSQCHGTLADMGETCFTRQGMILCKQDYYRMFRRNNVCQGCGHVIASDEYVMKTGPCPSSTIPPSIYHLKCFSCSKCGSNLQKGDKYSVLNGALYCEQDVLKLMKNGIGSPSNPNVAMTNGPAPRKGKVGRPRRSKD